jgi:hypothetical protein
MEPENFNDVKIIPHPRLLETLGFGVPNPETAEPISALERVFFINRRRR